MKKPAAKTTAKTFGQIAAEEVRAKANALTDAQRGALLERGLQAIYAPHRGHAQTLARRA